MPFSSRRNTGWIPGLVLGIVIGLFLLPPVRSMLSAQFQFAFSIGSLPWVRMVDASRTRQENKRLDRVAVLYPEDYLLQIGRATALANQNSIPRREGGESRAPSEEALRRLGTIARTFPTSTGAYAHLARYMMADRVRIQRAEIEEIAPASAPSHHTNTPASPSLKPESPGNSENPSPVSFTVPGDPTTRSVPARRGDVRLLEWALKAGELRDPNNAYWPAMLATTYFAALRDQEALRALARAKRKSDWHAYMYEEVLGQWRLYSAAYGDNGAAQKIAPLSLVVFPHLREIRRMAEMARWQADKAATDGHVSEAATIRRNLTWLGILMRDKAQWAYEALFGTDLIFIASTTSDVRLTQGTIRTPSDWEREASPHLRWLEANHFRSDVLWLRREVETSCSLRQRVDVARYDASYPGIPPGIPLIALFGNWIAGVCLLQQMLGLLTMTALWAVWGAWRRTGGRLPRVLDILAVILMAVVTAGSGVLLVSGFADMRIASLFLVGTVLLLLRVLEQISTSRRRKGLPDTDSSLSEAGADSLASAVPSWSNKQVILTLAAVLVPILAGLYMLRPVLSGMHPVAQMLTGLTGDLRGITIGESFRMAGLATAVPLALVLICALFARFRGFSPLEGIEIGLRRLAPPAATCLFFAYLLLLNHTLLLDAEASHAINEVAQNDLQWVLTHSTASE